MGREPNGVELAMFSLLWSEHCAYKHSRKLLEEPADRRPPRGHGSGRERRRRRHRQRLLDRLQGRVPQPPVRGRALPGCGDRGRRDPAGRDRPRRPPDRDPRFTPLRRTRHRTDPLPGRRCGPRHRPLRQLDGHPHGRWRDLLRAALRAEPAGQRDVCGHRPDRRDGPRRGGRNRQQGRPLRIADRPRRNRWRLGARLGRARRRR